MFLCIDCAELFPLGHRFPRGRCATCYVIITHALVTKPGREPHWPAPVAS